MAHPDDDVEINRDPGLPPIPPPELGGRDEEKVNLGSVSGSPSQAQATTVGGDLGRWIPTLRRGPGRTEEPTATSSSAVYADGAGTGAGHTDGTSRRSAFIGSAMGKLWGFFKFLGPGAIISVAYVDPDNYQTAISSGASFQYKLLFMILVSNLIAIYLQVRIVVSKTGQSGD
jgi:hypothetical protein